MGHGFGLIIFDGDTTKEQMLKAGESAYGFDRHHRQFGEIEGIMNGMKEAKRVLVERGTDGYVRFYNYEDKVEILAKYGWDE